jgi:hypothetical protein
LLVDPEPGEELLIPRFPCEPAWLPFIPLSSRLDEVVLFRFELLFLLEPGIVNSSER